jgi:acetolactate synthase-1/2/3 large subunit
VAQVLNRSKRTALFLGGRALREPALQAAAKVAAKTGVKLLAEVFPTRLERGAGRPPVERLAYLAELATVQLKDFDHLILVDAKAPVSFFAYPGKASELVPKHCTVHTLCRPDQDATASLEKLVGAVQAEQAEPVLQSAARPDRPRGRLTAEKVCKAVGHFMPEDTILIDEAITSGLMLPMMTAGAPRHDLMTLTGGAIGQGLPNAVGAAVACPDRPVLALVGDGAAMYTIQALWTMAREQLNVTSIVFNNAAYSVLSVELDRVGAERGGEKARAQLDLHNPRLDFTRLAQGMGVHAVRVDSTEGLCEALEYAFSQPGPHLIDAIVPEALNANKRRALPYVLGALPRLPAPLARFLKRKLAP